MPISIGFSGEESVSLPCEVHGYITTFNPPVWTSYGASFINVSKYAIIVSAGSNKSLIFPNGFEKQSIISTLTIHQLSAEHEGSYTCMTEGNRTVTQLLIMSASNSTSSFPSTSSTMPKGNGEKLASYS